MENGNYDKEVSSMGSRSSSSGNGARSRAAKQPFTPNKVAISVLALRVVCAYAVCGQPPIKTDKISSKHQNALG